MKLLFTLFLIVPAFCFAQTKLTIADLPYPIDSATNLVSYQGVVQVPNTTADQLYTRAKTFLFRAFRNASAVIQVDDKAGGLLGAKGLIMVVDNPGSLIRKAVELKLPIELRFKDGRFRYEITNLVSVFPHPVGEAPFDGDNYYAYRNTKPDKRYTKGQIEFAQKIDSTIRAFIDDLTKSLQKPSGKEDF